MMLHVAEGVEVLPHGLYDAGPLDEDVLYLGIDHVGECVVDLAFLLLDYREHSQGLGEDGKALGVDGKLTGLGDEGVALDAHEVADVEEFLEDGVVHGLVLAGADLVALDIDLNPAFGVLQLVILPAMDISGKGHFSGSYFSFISVEVVLTSKSAAG